MEKEKGPRSTARRVISVKKLVNKEGKTQVIKKDVKITRQIRVRIKKRNGSLTNGR